MFKKPIILSLIIALSLMLAGCGKTTSTKTTSSGDIITATTKEGTTETSTITTVEESVDLSDSTIIDISSITGTKYEITTGGIFAITGTNSNLQIVVNADTFDVVLLLSSCHISYGGSGATILVSKANSFTLKAVNGTSYLEDSEANTNDAVITVKSTDLVIESSGTMDITAKGLTSNDSGKAIHATKNLLIKSGTIVVESANDNAISGKQGINITGGSINVKNSNGDGLHTKEDTASIIIKNASITLNTIGDGIDAASTLHIENSYINIKTTATFVLFVEGNADGVESDDAKYIKENDTYKKISSDDVSRYSTRYYIEPSAKGLKSDTLIELLEGTYVIDSDDDAIHSNGNVLITGGCYKISTMDDAINATNYLTFGNENDTVNDPYFVVNIEESYEGIEASQINMYNGNIYVNSSDDGINISYDDDTTMITSDFYINIAGATYLVVNASGDGLDSNGAIKMMSGTVIVFGPTSSGNGALDYDSIFTLSGGTLVIVGSSGMAQVPNNTSLYTVSATFSSSSLTKGSSIYLGTSSYSIAINLVKDYTQGINVVVASPSLKSGDTVSIQYGGTSAGPYTDNIAENASYTGGTTLTTLSISSTLTTYGKVGINGQESGEHIGNPGQPGNGGMRP